MGGHTGGRSDAGPNKTVDYRNGKAINQKGKAPTRADLNKSGGVVDFIAGGGITGAIVRGVVKAGKAIKEDYKTRKTNESLLGTPDYQGGKTFSGSTAGGNDLTGDNENDGPRDLRTGKTIKSVEQPKVKSQMNNTDIKSDLITAKGPTTAEISDEQVALQNKRRGRKSTILTSVTGVDAYPTLSKKTLLG